MYWNNLDATLNLGMFSVYMYIIDILVLQKRRVFFFLFLTTKDFKDIISFNMNTKQFTNFILKYKINLYK